MSGLWLRYKIDFCKNKQGNQGNQGNQAHGKKREKHSDSNYFYIEESITCMNFRTRVTPFACTLRA